MTLQHVLSTFPSSIEAACIKVGVEYIDVPIDGKPHETGLINDPLGWGLGVITRPSCRGGAVINNKTGKSTLFVIPKAFLSIQPKRKKVKQPRKISNPIASLQIQAMRVILGSGDQQ